MSANQDLTLPLIPLNHYHIFNRGNEKRKIFSNNDNYVYFMKRYAEYTDAHFDTYSYCLLDNHFHIFLKPKSEDEILTAALVDFEFVDSTFYNRYGLNWLRSIGLNETYVGGKKGRDCAKWRDLTVLRELIGHIALHPPQPNQTPDHLTHKEQLDFKNQLCSYIISERPRRFMLSSAKAINKQQDRTGSLFQKAFRRKLVYGIDNLKRVITYIHHNVIHHNYAYHYDAYSWSSFVALSTNKDTKLQRTEVMSWFGGRDQFLAYSDLYKKYKWTQELFYIEES